MTVESLKTKSSGTHIMIGQRMIRSNNSRDSALGALIVYGSYNDRCKVFANWERVINKYL